MIGHFSLHSFTVLVLILFSITRNVRSNTEFGLRTTILQDVFHHFIIAVRCFNEQLSLVFGINPLLQSPYFFGTALPAHRKVTWKAKLCPLKPEPMTERMIEEGSHQGHYFQILPLSNRHYIRSRSATAGQPGFGNHSIDNPAITDFRYPKYLQVSIAWLAG